jgi:hypothetical protein
MKKSAIYPLPEYYHSYIDRVEDIQLIDALKKYHIGYLQSEYKNLKKLGEISYAHGKWTVKDVLQHVVDTERIMSCRAMRIGRNDKTPLPGFDQDLLAASAHASNRTVGEILREFELVRETTIILFKNFDDEMLLRKGNCSNIDISALALGFVIVGHAIHHLNIISERYFPLLENPEV